MKYLFLITFLSVSFTSFSQSKDEEAVKAAISDYVEAFYQGDTARLYRSIHPELAKRGFYKKPTGEYAELKMTFKQANDLVKKWYKTNDTSKAPKIITIYEVQDQTAVGKLEAAWGTDYFHLGKYDGKWMIVNVIWQSIPKSN
jgi:hypothetical protein